MATKRAPAAATPSPPPARPSVPPNHYPLFKGATRVPTVKGGVPTRAFLALALATLFVASFTLWGWLLAPLLYPVIAVLSRNDDRAFWILELWVRTKVIAPNKHYWGAISLTPTPYCKRRRWRRRIGDSAR